MLPDAIINTNNRVTKNKNIVSTPNASTVKTFSKVDKGFSFNNSNLKKLANSQSKKAISDDRDVFGKRLLENKDFKENYPAEYKIFEEYVDKGLTTFGSADLYEKHWKGFDSFARGRAAELYLSVGVGGYENFKGLRSALGSVMTLLDMKELHGYLPNASEYLDISIYGPSYVSKSTYEEGFGGYLNDPK